MIWHSREEPERLGPPTRKNMIWAILAIPLLLTQLSVIIFRLVESLRGKPLLVSGFLDISVAWSAEPIGYSIAALVYILLIGGLTLLLWGCALWIQQWAYFRRR